MKESHYKKFMLGMYLVLAGIFVWAIYVEQPEQWWKEAGLVVLLSAAYFWLVRVACNISRRHGGFTPEVSAGAERKG